ncbi:hypothetical protein RASY3_14425 [Ruminococcus albus SY3]|uniref:Uncharacterized protein n=1 Tax=Ruminococcus albus SY3 TaxID=1341156 RepID=A0A011VVE2_RUMAL|nr:hypothetical protein [Ruminococcus albus]EXM38523.1 hypothetical protein RASY3_14425 [Ruminococcus albus SY3]
MKTIRDFMWFVFPTNNDVFVIKDIKTGDKVSFTRDSTKSPDWGKFVEKYYDMPISYVEFEQGDNKTIVNLIVGMDRF